jgi:hypothetical protein
MTEDTNELLWQQDDVAPSYPGDFAYELGWVALGETLGDDEGCEAARAMGEAIVGCEEMQAIKAVLLSLASLNTALLSLASLNTAGAARIDVLRLAGLPETVIDWVFS